MKALAGRFARYIAGAAIALLLVLTLWPPVPDPRTELRVVYVTPRQFEKLEPDTKVGIIERVVRPPAELEQRVIAAGAADDMIADFMRSVEAFRSRAELFQADSSNIPAALPGPAPAPLALAYAGRQSYRQLELFTAVSDGSKQRLTYDACPPVDWRLVGDSALVQSYRGSCIVPEILGLGGAGALVFGATRGDVAWIIGGTAAIVVREWWRRR